MTRRDCVRPFLDAIVSSDLMHPYTLEYNYQFVIIFDVFIILKMKNSSITITSNTVIDSNFSCVTISQFNHTKSEPREKDQSSLVIPKQTLVYNILLFFMS
ncbi:F12M16.7 [Arabidopsis thaliana]|uniref:F12M16.7 n=1 Tax=Arabidopsis thaliana TaxID=3702 RepID=Q9MAI4_ARATH|nr:F12M16.7 [Arabidopsis thaliana]